MQISEMRAHANQEYETKKSPERKSDVPPSQELHTELKGAEEASTATELEIKNTKEILSTGAGEDDRHQIATIEQEYAEGAKELATLKTEADEWDEWGEETNTATTEKPNEGQTATADEWGEETTITAPDEKTAKETAESKIVTEKMRKFSELNNKYMGEDAKLYKKIRTLQDASNTEDTKNQISSILDQSRRLYLAHLKEGNDAIEELYATVSAENTPQSQIMEVFDQTSSNFDPGSTMREFRNKNYQGLLRPARGLLKAEGRKPFEEIGSDEIREIIRKEKLFGQAIVTAEGQNTKRSVDGTMMDNLEIFLHSEPNLDKSGIKEIEKISKEMEADGLHGMADILSKFSNKEKERLAA